MESIISYTAVTMPARSYTKEQWEEQRDIITLHYRDNGVSFHKLRAELARQRSFYPRYKIHPPLLSYDTKH